MASRITEAQKTLMRKLHGEGSSATSIAKQMGCAVVTVSRLCKAEGLSFDTAQTAAATVSHRNRTAAHRARIEGDLLDKIDAIMNRVIPSVDERGTKDLMSAVSSALTGSLKIAQHDAVKDDAHSDVDKFLKHLTGG